MENNTSSLMKLTLYDRIFKPQTVTLPNGHSVQRRRRENVPSEKISAHTSAMIRVGSVRIRPSRNRMSQTIPGRCNLAVSSHDRL